ncbi:MAG TPA: hypothetical protein PKA41_15590 [Verrucomicrobiota bacterium]|nr:hypothetical protein [Verrucomicrobiota bacterium]
MKKHPSSKTGIRKPRWLMLALAVGLTAAQCAQAGLLKYDSFTYNDGDALGLGSSAANWNGGSSTGSGAWTNRAEANLSYTGLAPSSGGGVRLNVVPSSNRDRGTVFTTQSISGSNPNVYCSFLMSVAQAPSGNKLIAYLRSDTGAGTPVVGVWLDSNMRVGVTKSSDSAGRISFSSGSISLNTPHFFVARYHYVNGETTGDSADVWVDPHPGTFTATEMFIPPPTVSTNFGSARDTIQSFVLANKASGGGSALADLYVDEVRVGTTWADVTPSVPGMATKLTFTTPPVDASVNATMSPVVVQVQDSYGTPISQSGISVTVKLLVGNGTLSGTLTKVTDGTGKVTFDNLSINKINAVAVLSATATAANLYEATSGLFTVGGGGGTPKTPLISQSLRTPTSMILRGNNGDAGQPYDVVASTSLGTPRGSWSTVGSSSFDGSGNFDFTNSVSPSEPVKFYSIKPTGTGSGGGGVEGPTGFATVGPGVTGGAGGPVRIVDTLAAFTAYGQSPDPVIILLRTNLVLGTSSSHSSFYLGPNKTIIGVGTNVTITGNVGIYGSVEVTTPATNVILRNLVFTNPGDAGEGDGVTVKYGGSHVWVDHCTFVDCADGMLDVTREGDYVTVSWCKFYYTVTNFNSHPDVNLIGGSDDDVTDDNKLHVTFHHNWWSSWCRERMPSVRFGSVHVYNNYFNAPGNNYCTRARLQSEVRIENNYYHNVWNPWELATSSKGPNGLLYASGNITNNCTWGTSHYNPNLPNSGVVLLVPGTDTVFTPPYAYTLDPAADILNSVTSGAGAGRGPFAP